MTKKQLTPQQQVVKYYSKLGSRLGYRFVMRRSQHFGYYDKQHTTESAAQQKYHQEFAKRLGLKPGLKLLDAGCGQGVVACYLAKNHNVHVTGITLVPHEVAHAQKLATKKGVQEKTEFIIADYADPPFKPNTFDIIYTTETLSHAVDVNVVLRQFYKLLKPGGKLVCAEYEFDHKRFGAEGKFAAEFTKRHAAIHAIDQFDRGLFLQKIKAAGFKQVTEEDWTKPLTPSFDRLERLSRPSRSIIKKLKLNKFFVNVMAAEMYSEGVKRKTFYYKVYSAAKPV